MASSVIPPSSSRFSSSLSFSIISLLDIVGALRSMVGSSMTCHRDEDERVVTHPLFFEPLLLFFFLFNLHPPLHRWSSRRRAVCRQPTNEIGTRESSSPREGSQPSSPLKSQRRRYTISIALPSLVLSVDLLLLLILLPSIT